VGAHSERALLQALRYFDAWGNNRPTTVSHRIVVNLNLAGVNLRDAAVFLAQHIELDDPALQSACRNVANINKHLLGTDDAVEIGFLVPALLSRIGVHSEQDVVAALRDVPRLKEVMDDYLNRLRNASQSPAAPILAGAADDDAVEPLPLPMPPETFVRASSTAYERRLSWLRRAMATLGLTLLTVIGAELPSAAQTPIPGPWAASVQLPTATMSSAREFKLGQNHIVRFAPAAPGNLDYAVFDGAKSGNNPAKDAKSARRTETLNAYFRQFSQDQVLPKFFFITGPTDYRVRYYYQFDNADGTLSRYEIFVNTDYLNEKKNPGIFERVWAHEVIHWLTLGKMIDAVESIDAFARNRAPHAYTKDHFNQLQKTPYWQILLADNEFMAYAGSEEIYAHLHPDDPSDRTSMPAHTAKVKANLRATIVKQISALPPHVRARLIPYLQSKEAREIAGVPTTAQTVEEALAAVPVVNYRVGQKTGSSDDLTIFRGKSEGEIRQMLRAAAVTQLMNDRRPVLRALFFTDAAALTPEKWDAYQKNAQARDGLISVAIVNDAKGGDLDRQVRARLGANVPVANLPRHFERGPDAGFRFDGAAGQRALAEALSGRFDLINIGRVDMIGPQALSIDCTGVNEGELFHRGLYIALERLLGLIARDPLRPALEQTIQDLAAFIYASLQA
jgi:hypothetical protein